MSDNPYAAPTTEVTPSAPAHHTIGTMPSPYGGYRDLKVFHVILLILFSLGIISALGEIYAAELMNQGLTLLDEGGDFEATINQADALSQSFNGLSVTLFFVTVIFWGIWKNKSCKNAWLFYSHSALPNHFADNPTPGWSVGYYFVPILNLWKPFQAMAFIRDQSSGFTKVGPLLGFWWAGWLVMNFYSRYTAKMDTGFTSTTQAISFNNNLITESIITIVASFLAAAVIHQLSVAQKRKARDLGALS